MAQAPTWQSAHAVAVATAAVTGNNLNLSEVTATATDGAGNVYLTGHFTNTVTLGSTTLTSFGEADIFVAKFNPASNQFVWVQRAGGSGTDRAHALAVSGTSVYVAGHFNSLMASFGATTLTNAGPVNAYDGYVAKLTDAGSTSSFVWSQRIGGRGDDHAFSLAASGSNVYVAGHFASPTASFGATTLTSAGDSDVYVAKLTDAGSFVWAQRAGGRSADLAFALAVSGTSVYIAGDFYGSTANFGATTLTNVGPTNTFDVFVAKLTDAGNSGSFVWAQRAGGRVDDLCGMLAVSGTSVYIAGEFYGTTTNFGAITLTNAGPSNTCDMFVAKLTDAGSTGSFVWAQRAGGAGNERAGALVVGNTGVHVAGGFNGATTNFGATTLTNAGGYDVYVAKLTDAGSTGSFVWAQRAGGTGDDNAFALAVSGTSVYVAGSFVGPTTSFGVTTLTNPYFIAFEGLGLLSSLTDLTLAAKTSGPAVAPAHLFPNPAQGTATLRRPVGLAPEALTLCDALGRPVRRYPAPTGATAALDLRGLPTGLYLLYGAGPVQRLQVE
ncbi:hypothetical protein GCM10028821_38360 [Hymenobacter jeollabukensis]